MLATLCRRAAILGAFILLVASLSPALAADTYIDAQHLGVGPTWMTVPDSNRALNDQVGFFSGRYWFNNRFGVDAGIGLGFPQMTPTNVTELDLNVEPMFALAMRKHTILYADAALTPGFQFVGSGGGTTTVFDMSAGVGLEKAFEELPQAAFFAQWNPLGFNITMPPHGDTAFGMGILGSVMNFGVGFHYYL